MWWLVQFEGCEFRTEGMKAVSLRIADYGMGWSCRWMRTESLYECDRVGTFAGRPTRQPQTTMMSLDGSR